MLVSTVAIDLGPALRQRAEEQGSRWLDRPMHIGKLGVRLAPGRFVIEDLRIEGLTPDARPWLVAKRIEVSLTWRALFNREVLVDSIEMADWKMVVESFSNGRHNWPRLNGPPRAPRNGPPMVVTTMQFVRATRGEFVFDDHGSRWGVVAPNLEVTAGKLAEYRGRAKFSRRHGLLPRLPADVRRHDHELQGPGRKDRPRSDQPQDRRRGLRDDRASSTRRAGRRCSTR